jgi:hypothetical protein
MSARRSSGGARAETRERRAEADTLAPLVPAEAGTQSLAAKHWMPACAGMSGGFVARLGASYWVQTSPISGSAIAQSHCAVTLRKNHAPCASARSAAEIVS